MRLIALRLFPVRDLIKAASNVFALMYSDYTQCVYLTAAPNPFKINRQKFFCLLISIRNQIVIRLISVNDLLNLENPNL